MKFTAVLTALSVAAATHVAVAMPADKRGAISDIDILNFALTLEHLENTFYRQSLLQYSVKDFADAGFPNWVRDRYKQIAAHEQTHVDFLSRALGDKAVRPCEYKFPVQDVKSFVSFSNMLEQVGASAYTGAAKYLENKSYLTAAATILTVEARHAAWIDSSVRMSSAWGDSFDIALDPNQVLTIASALIKHCPESNAHLPFNTFPPLSLSLPDSQPKSIMVSFNCKTCDKPQALFATFLTGKGVISTSLKNVKKTKSTFNAEVMVPKGLMGYVYLLVTDDGTNVNDQTTKAGPAVLEFSVDSMGKVISTM